MKSAVRSQPGKTSITMEYALLAALVAIAAIQSLVPNLTLALAAAAAAGQEIVAGR